MKKSIIHPIAYHDSMTMYVHCKYIHHDSAKFSARKRVISVKFWDHRHFRELKWRVRVIWREPSYCPIMCWMMRRFASAAA